jgi:hypothetical protein
MRVRHRWLLLSVFVAAVLIVLTILARERSDRAEFTISFLGYTNLPDAKVRSAIFVLTNQSQLPLWIPADPWGEFKGLTGSHVYSINTHPRILPLDFGKAEAYSFTADEPGDKYAFSEDGGSWRVSFVVSHPGTRLRLLTYVARRGLLPGWLRYSLRNWPIPHEWSNHSTNSSIWLTNSTSFQQQP